MSFNTFGKIFRFTTWGESHGPAIGCVIDGCPPNIPLTESDIQADMDRRRPGQSKFTTQRKEPDKAIILSGVFEGKTTGTPISIIIYNEDKKSRDYESIKNKFRLPRSTSIHVFLDIFFRYRDIRRTTINYTPNCWTMGLPPCGKSKYFSKSIKRHSYLMYKLFYRIYESKKWQKFTRNR